MSERTGTCPICKKTIAAPGKGAPLGDFPFCSERCKSADLGLWLDEGYRIADAPEWDGFQIDPNQDLPS